MPGVIGIFTATDLGLVPLPSPFAPPFTSCPLAFEVVRYVGEPIAVVVTERPSRAPTRPSSSWSTTSRCPRCRPVRRRSTVTSLLFPEIGTNVCGDSAFMGAPPEDPELFAGCEVVVSERLVNQRLAPCPLEVRSAAAAWTADGTLVHWATSQIPHMVHMVLGQIYGPRRCG